MKNKGMLALIVSVCLCCILGIASLRKPCPLSIAPDVVETMRYLSISDSAIIRIDSSWESYKYPTGENETDVLIQRIIKNSRFRLDEEEVNKKALEIAISRTPDYLLYGDMAFSDYLATYLGISPKEFFKKCYEDAETEIKYYLTIGAIAYLQNLSPSKQDIVTWCSSKQIELNQLDEESECYVRYHIIEAQVLSLFAPLPPSSNFQMENTYQFEQSALNLYNVLLSQFPDISLNGYPEAFGGAYLRDDGKLAIMVVENAEEQDFFSFPNYEDYVIVPARFPLNALLSAYEAITSCMQDYRDKYPITSKEYELFDGIVSVCTNEMENCIEVNIADFSTQKEALFFKIFSKYDQEMFEFYNGCVTLLDY